MIAHPQCVGQTAGLLACLWSPDERGDQRFPRLVRGGCHGARIGFAGHTDTVP
jgi:hypothetical protein